MKVKVRLSRGGSKKNPHYSIVVAESGRKRDGKFIEKIGHYHPTLDKENPNRVVINKERLLLRISQGVIPTDIVCRLARELKIELPAHFYKDTKPSKYSGLSKKEVKKAIEQDKEEDKAKKEELKKSKDDSVSEDVPVAKEEVTTDS